jgi:hypothetical protein
MAIYESEYTKFMRELLLQKPQIVEEQKKGRAIWWDRKPNPDQVRPGGEAPEGSAPRQTPNKT